MSNDYSFLEQLIDAPSPTGFEEPAAALIRQRLAGCADEVNTDVMGSVHALLKGSGSAPSVLLSAHMDEIGLMVSYIDDDGFIRIGNIGGVDANILPGLRVEVHTAQGVLKGVVCRKPIHLIPKDDKSSVSLDDCAIDVGFGGKKVKEMVCIGDPITFAYGFERFGENMAVSRAFDDKIGVWIAINVLERLSASKANKGDFIAAATTQEEIGMRGATTTAHKINPDVALAFDVTHATDYPGIDKNKFGDIRCGGGPVIARGPNINPIVFGRLVASAKKEGIPYQIEAEPHATGTDARVMQVSRDGIASGLVSVALRYMHTPTEVVSLSDVENTIKLITRFVADMDENASFIPGISLVK
ncbi:MAG: M42 family metallopeptidase [Eggerthellaceae bacterium]|nr:M42 family metallopeptidase [Eggerthellaceae bacterium]